VPEGPKVLVVAHHLRGSLVDVGDGDGAFSGLGCALEHAVAERLNEERLTRADLNKPVTGRWEVAQPRGDRFRHQTLGVFEGQRADPQPVAETKKRGPVLLAEPFQTAGAGENG